MYGLLLLCLDAGALIYDTVPVEEQLIGLHGLHCHDGTETLLTECPRQITHQYYYRSDCRRAGVNCTARSPCTDGTIRLRGGTISSRGHEGHVEICRSNTWGRVCRNDWSLLDAQVVCRQLGYFVPGMQGEGKAR